MWSRNDEADTTGLAWNRPGEPSEAAMKTIPTHTPTKPVELADAELDQVTGGIIVETNAPVELSVTLAVGNPQIRVAVAAGPIDLTLTPPPDSDFR